MNKKIKLTEEEINALKVIANSDFDLLDAIRSVTHSASIRKGYFIDLRAGESEESNFF